jgi:S-adenosylmethionine uptake transporter
MPALWMLFASFAFALMGTCVKLAAGQYSIAQIVTVRGLVGVALLFLVARFSQRSLKTTEALSHLWRGLLGVVSLWLWFAAIARLPLATAVTLNYMSPIWTAVALAGIALWRGEGRVAWPLVGTILVSFIGVVLVLRPAFAADQWLGGLMALASGALAALAYLMVRRLSRKGEPEYRVVFYFSLLNVGAGLAGMLVLPAAPAAHGGGWSGVALLLGVGLTGTAGQLALTRAYRLGRTLVVANLQYSGIVFSSLLGGWIWGDAFDWTVWAGIAVILGSCIAAGLLGRRPVPSAQTQAAVLST